MNKPLRLPNKAGYYVRLAQEKTKQARKLSAQAAQAAEEGNTRLATELSLRAENASIEAEYFMYQAQYPEAA